MITRLAPCIKLKMNRRNCLKLLAGLLPCALVARILGEKDLHGTPSPNPAWPAATHEIELQLPGLWQCSVETENLVQMDDETMVREFERINRNISLMIASAKKQNREIRDIKLYWRNVPYNRGSDRFMRVIMRSCDPSCPVLWRNPK